MHTALPQREFLEQESDQGHFAQRPSEVPYGLRAPRHHALRQQGRANRVISAATKCDTNTIWHEPNLKACSKLQSEHQQPWHGQQELHDILSKLAYIKLRAESWKTSVPGMLHELLDLTARGTAERQGCA